LALFDTANADSAGGKRDAPQPLRDQRKLRLAGVGTTAPGLELKALGDAQGRENRIQFVANI
jgi:hypothetical protein